MSGILHEDLSLIFTLFWNITQLIVVNSLPTFRGNLSIPFSKVKKSVRRVMSQKIADLI